MATSSTKYLRLRVSRTLSRSSDYSSPIFSDTLEATSTPTRSITSHETLAVTGGTTIDLAPFGNVDQVVVFNRDDTNFVTVTFRNTDNGATDNICRAGPGAFVAVGDAITVASDIVLTADTADCECIVDVYGTV